MSRRPPGVLRVIGGAWRSRRVVFADLPELRPTPDRVRQILFDWLTPIVHGSRCLDAFAGSGLLGIEALSRGAATVVFVERAEAAAAAIRQALAALDAQAPAQVLCTDALAHLQQPGPAYDVVFLDPPYRSDLLAAALPAAAARLAPHGRLYLEWRGAAPALPQGFALVREKRAGRVSFGLAAHAA
ncbi:MAG: 16S rRNA (guanine(966)-N(2))-methyltransferase RsmD [Gammaproteobacteria bacterium]|nr:16S rRNA (guanine(966)-N(2))-methyltransferase RsmD [Gammaproteobacteria bacterium]